jgi:hypothetical protein
MTDPHEVALLRLAAQRLVGRRCDDAADAVRWLTAAQAQDFSGAQLSVALRVRGGTREGVLAALDAGEVVRSWPMRGTLHVVAAEDLPWMLDLLAPRVVARFARRRAELGLTETQLEHARGVAVAALTGGRGLSRTELFTVWERAGHDVSGQRGAHTLGYLAQTGTLVLGPTADGDQRVVLVSEWIPRPRVLGREEALAELALRYFRGHGPATVADLARWAGLGVREARDATSSARGDLTTLEVDGVEHLMDPRTPELLDAAREEADGVLLLPGFDELMLGYGDRSAQLDPAHADRIVPGGNGMFRATVVSAGQVVGTWARRGRGATATVTTSPFGELAPGVAEAVTRAFARLP